MSKLQCSTIVYHTGNYQPGHYCQNKVAVERDGKLYCKQHDPVAVTEKWAARHAAWEAKREAERQADRDRQAAQDLLVRKAAAFDQIMAVCKIGSSPTLCFLADLLQEFEEATHE